VKPVRSRANAWNTGSRRRFQVGETAAAGRRRDVLMPKPF
jgi:hypothetical protein